MWVYNSTFSVERYRKGEKYFSTLLLIIVVYNFRYNDMNRLTTKICNIVLFNISELTQKSLRLRGDLKIVAEF